MEFQEEYKKLTNIDLFIIIENSFDYQKEAVECAEEILSKRKLNDFELNELRLEYNKIIQLESEKSRNKEAQVNKIYDNISKAYNILDPLSSKGKINSIKVTSAFFLVIILYKFYLLYKMIFLLEFQVDASVILYLFPIVYIGIMIYGLLKIKKFGYLMLICYSVYYSIWSFVKILVNSISENLNHSDNLIQNYSRLDYAFILLFVLAMLAYYSQNRIRETFKVTKKVYIRTLLITILIFIVAAFPTVFNAFN